MAACPSPSPAAAAAAAATPASREPRASGEAAPPAGNALRFARRAAFDAAPAALACLMEPGGFGGIFAVPSGEPPEAPALAKGRPAASAEGLCGLIANGFLVTDRLDLAGLPEGMLDTRRACGGAAAAGLAPLHEAAQAKHGGADNVEALVNAGADINVLGPGGFSPLMFAAQAGCDDAARMLLRHNANIWIASTHGGKTALDLAVASGHIGIVVLLCFVTGTVDALKSNGGGKRALDAAEKRSFRWIAGALRALDVASPR